MELGLGLVVTLIGMVVVFLTLIVLMYVVLAPKVILASFAKKETRPTKSSPSVSSAAIPAQHIAAISAVVAALGLGRLHKIVLTDNDNWEQRRYTEITKPF